MKSRRFAAILIFFCCMAILVAYVDRPLSEWLRTIDAGQRDLVDFFRFWTDLGKSKWYLWPAALGIGICALLVRLKSVKPHLRKQAAKLGDFLLFLFISVALSGIITDIIKPILGRARPVELDQEGLYGFHPFSFVARWNSMPSGHATTGVALALVLAGTYPRLRIPAFLFAFLLAISRVMVNAHFLSDAVAGAAVGFLTVVALEKLWAHNGICHINKCIFPIDKKPARR